MKKILSCCLGLFVFLSLSLMSCADDGVCSISVGVDGVGEVSITNYIGTSANVPLGTDVQVIAVPEKGYDFIGWYDGKTLVSEKLKFTFKAGRDIVLVAKFKEKEEEKYCISVEAVSGGVVSITGYSGYSVYVYPGKGVEVVAKPREGYRFIGWYDDEVLVSESHAYSFNVASNLVLVARFVLLPSPVDLGLPSGIKWATCNFGASVPEEFGIYFAWGETGVKEIFSWETYRFCYGDMYSMNKYCTDSSFGNVDGKEVLERKDDAASVWFGDYWRMPTKEEQDELREFCTWEWVAINGVEGYKVTGPNGNNIFLPAAGSCGIEGVRKPAGYYLSSSLDEEYSCRANCLTFNKLVYSNYRYYRCCGFSIRPVCY